MENACTFWFLNTSFVSREHLSLEDIYHLVLSSHSGVLTVGRVLMST
ncbi:hypothetical protein OIU78_002572 [Salix suchowensis]|nr:hypothetical protein OIU78_002572 [Salix suchowensis]